MRRLVRKIPARQSFERRFPKFCARRETGRYLRLPKHSKRINAALKALLLAGDTFETAIALAKNQIVAYVGLATAYAMVNKQAECRDWAQRGLVELVEMRKEFQEIDARQKAPVGGYKSAYPAAFIDGLYQLERQLRGCLES